MIMNNKNIKIAVAALATSLAFSSCLFEEDEIFDESAALRGQHFTESIDKVLYTPENGWVMQYFPNSSPILETQEVRNESAFTTLYQKGYNIFVRFYEDQSCVMTSNHEYIRENILLNTPGVMRTDTSLFCINEQDGPLLSFNTWNDILSVFSDPVNPVSVQKGIFDNKDGQGLQGDNEFVVLSVSEDMILMRGERHDARVRLIKADRPQNEYIAAVQQVEKDFMEGPITEYMVVSSKDNYLDTLYAYDMATGLVTFAPRQGEEWISTEGLAYVCGTSGIHFQFPEEFSFSHINGPGDTVKWSNKVQDFLFTEQHDAMVSDNNELMFCPNWQKYILQCMSVSRQVTFLENEGSDSWKEIYATLSSAITSAYSKQKLMTICFGASSENGTAKRTGLVFQTNSSTYVGFPATAHIVDDIITFDIDSEDPSGNFKNYKSKGIDGQFTAVANYLQGSWKMTCDNAFAPKYIILTNVADATKVVSLKVVK